MFSLDFPLFLIASLDISLLLSLIHACSLIVESKLDIGCEGFQELIIPLFLISKLNSHLFLIFKLDIHLLLIPNLDYSLVLDPKA